MPSSAGEVSLSRLSAYSPATMPVTSRFSYSSTSSYSPRSYVHRATSLERGSYSPLSSKHSSVYSSYSSSSSSSAPSRPPLPSASIDYRRRYDIGSRTTSSSRRETAPFDMDSLGKLTEARKYLMERRAAEAQPSSPSRPRYSRTESREVTGRSTLDLPSRSARGSIAGSTSHSRQESVERVSDRILNFESRSSSGYGSSSGAASPASTRRRSERVVPIVLDSDRRPSTEVTERRPSVSELRRQFDAVVAATSSTAAGSSAAVSSDDDSSSTLSSSSQSAVPVKESRKTTSAPAPPSPPPSPPPAPAVTALAPAPTPAPATRVVGGRTAEPERPASPVSHKLTNGLSNGLSNGLTNGLTNGHHKERPSGEKEVSSVSSRQSSLLSEPTLRRQRTESSGSSSASTSPAAERPTETVPVQYGPQDGLTGLRNIGNTCFMNSVLQCLSNTRALHDYILRDGFTSEVNTTTSSMKGALIQAFADLMQDLWKKSDETDRVVTTAPFKSQIQRFAPRFMGYQQQDAQEFLRYLLEGLHEDVNRVTSRPRPITEDIDDNLSDSQKAMESWKRFMRFDNSKFVDLFVGQLKSTLRCTVCGHASVTFDPFWDLSLPIPAKTGQVRLQACFDLFTKEEVLDGDEKPTCAKCQKRQKCTKSFAIQKFPRILVVHLKRFSPQERYRGKLNSVVDFPLCGLDLSAYSEGQGSCKYSLYGVANHSGTLYSGHYTAYCRHPYSSEWHEYNDSRIRTTSMRSVVSKEAYVLFFELAGSPGL